MASASTVLSMRGPLMFRTFAAASLLALACAMPLQPAAAQDPIAGGIFGGAVGGLLGGAIGGRGGAVAGGIICGATRAAGAARRPRRHRYYLDSHGCFVGHTGGRYTQGPPPHFGPRPAVAPA